MIVKRLKHMEMIEDVKRILDKDEEIVKSYYPNKKRYVLFNSIVFSFFSLLIASIIIVIAILGITGVIAFTNEEGSRDTLAPYIMLGVSFVPFSVAVFGVVANIVRFKKTIYVITNKRVVVRTGFIGADYQSIRIQDIGMLNVRVDFLDKFVKPNSGSIIFATSSTPVYDNRNRGYGQFAFLHIDNPYEVYQEIKEYIDNIK